MTTSPPSNSSGQASSEFLRLHPGVQKWIWQQKWPALRPIQEQAIPPILEGEKDVIISAATAGGKTEAAFLPIFSRLMEENGAGVGTLCVSPLKALINDQFRRLSEIGEQLNMAVTPWHGDIDAGRKKRLLKQPRGILIITPESLEALFVCHGPDIATVFYALNYLVVDELHAFIGTERGKQLQSLMHRVEQVIRRRVPRIGLSATIGDMNLAAEFLRPGKADQVKLIASEEEGQEIQLQVRGYRKAKPALEKQLNLEAGDDSDEAVDSQDEIDIAAHLFRVLRGDTNLIFINSRSEVESYTDRLRRLSEQQRVPNEFLPHHGSLSKDIREEAEQALKSDKPANVICTTTLEMGIDIGAVKSIAQVGAPFSVSSTRQRLGRSGRKEGDPAIIRFYITEPEVTPTTTLQDSIHPALVQTIAIVNLMVFERWCEPPIVTKLHLSTLIQQVLSLIAQYGGVNALQLYQVLCQTGAFRQVPQEMFIKLLRQLGAKDLIQQTHDGVLILGLKGERLVNHYSFYTAFQTPEEYRIVTPGKTLGTLPIDFPLFEGMYIIFAGHRWKVLAVDAERKVVDVVRAAAGRVPIFSGGGGLIHDKIRQEMYRIYCSEDIPVFLDRTAVNLLNEGRENFFRLGLDNRNVVKDGNQTLLFCWMGSQVVNTICLLLRAQGLEVGIVGVANVVQDVSTESLMEHLETVVKMGPVDVIKLAEIVEDKVSEKHDHFLSNELLCWNYASSYLAPQRAWETLRLIVKSS
ncbi:DEAD/DEAH box helicase [Nodosilinea sp. PGN35]|uniref:DEAD/DEAH box helicase n=1 Tax=Nodosilinea sp. PGN35 TaxID=3020489 RepID=UPI0023B2F290|nr:DEAD/DEAH box helicase [Nodosilinea sp. TSF1-S3]MDF0367046.1 DEAD/DEAH box helicase [Nodosilinea sp. TSF1-S3]